ncbi:MAG TPA: TonB-dependent receptor, partial [Vicinamibacterales bacterium]|nr:TonB-dependent receptor [Vicinamibacterales bacterium]
MSSTADLAARFRHLAAAWLLSVSALGAVAEAQETGGRIEGTVRDATGTPASTASVTISGPVRRALQVGADGRFVVDSLPDGTYTITATLPGLAPSSRTTEIVGGGTVAVALVLLPEFLQQVTVTVDKTGERELQKIPMAVSVLTHAQLRPLEVHTVGDLAGLAPGVTVAQNTGFSQLTIRGIGSNLVFTGSDPSSAVYVDGVYVARPAAVLTEFVGLDRIEVLRGPQGTLYGHNAVGGALNLSTRVPGEELAFSARFVAGNLRTLRAEVDASGPLIGGRVLASVSAVRGNSDGYVGDLSHPDRPLGESDVSAGRAVVRVRFNDRRELRVRGDYSHGDPTPLTYSKVLAPKPGFTFDNPPGLHRVRTSADTRSRRVDSGASAQFIWRLTPTTVVTSLSAFRYFDYDLRVDNDATELQLSIGNTREIHRQISQELTVTGESRLLRWTSGMFAFRDRDRQPVLTELPSSGLTNSLDPVVESRILAAFGQTTVRLGSRLGAAAGIRYSHDRKSIENAGRSMAADHLVSSFQYRDRTSTSAWTPKFALEYQMDGGTLGYVSATRGYKSGGFNITAPEARGGFSPEWAWTYEAGFKSSPLGGRARLNGAVYFTDYTDLQVQTPIRPGVIDIRNAATAEIRGLELEAQLQPASGWSLGGHAAWLDATYEHYLAIGPGGTLVDVAGRRLFNAPEWSGRTWVEHVRPLLAASTLSVSVEAVMQSTVYFTPLNDPVERPGAFGVVNAAVVVRPSRRWSVGMFARNL